ncbi:Peroxisomal membrane protein PMP27 [Blastocladiella emersonii ATCC 22665]|nr:Peroxisomal membrane protein PMP27 [Blastocladiella emersonii ATCC 22665]
MAPTTPAAQILAALPLIIKYTATTTGRDKVYRLVQYLCKFLAYRLAQTDSAGSNKDLVAKLTKLVKHLSLSRKLMRIGRPIEYAQNLITGLATQRDEVIKYCVVGKNALLTVWMGYDFLAWAQGVGLWKSDNPTTFSNRLNKFWFSGLVCGLVSTAYQIHKNETRLAAVKAASGNASEEIVKEEKALIANRRKLARQIFQESLDILVPAKGLGYIGLSDGVIGLTGALTSLMGVQAQWKKVHGGK